MFRCDCKKTLSLTLVQISNKYVASLEILKISGKTPRSHIGSNQVRNWPSSTGVTAFLSDGIECDVQLVASIKHYGYYVY